jgi:DNA-binding response OmpR family regulator
MTTIDCKTILIVEDSSLLRAVVADALSSAGFRTLEAGDGKEGLEKARGEHPDLILLDLIMPVMDGMEMYQLLRMDAWGEFVPVIMLTATKDEKLSSWLDAKKLDFFLKDNWMMNEVVARVKERLGVV